MRHRDCRSRPIFRDPVEDGDARLPRPGHHGIGRLEPGRTSVRLEEPGPALIDLERRHPFPGAGVGLTQAHVTDHIGQSELIGNDRGGLRRPRQVARGDERELQVVIGREGAADRPRLAPAELGERRIGDPLPALHGVPLALAVPDEQQPNAPDHASRVRVLVPVRCLSWQSCACSVRPPNRRHRPGQPPPAARSPRCWTAARDRYGVAFGDVLTTCRVWVNGDRSENTPPSALTTR